MAGPSQAKPSHDDSSFTLHENDGVYISTSPFAYDRKNFLDSVFAPTTDLPVVPICRS
jgi:hypothetical protein